MTWAQITKGFLFLDTDNFPLQGPEKCAYSQSNSEEVSHSQNLYPCHCLFLGPWKLEALVSCPRCGCGHTAPWLCSHRVEKQPTGVLNAQVPATRRAVNDFNKAGAAFGMWVQGSMSHLISFSNYIIERLFKCSWVYGCIQKQKVKNKKLPSRLAGNYVWILNFTSDIVCCAKSFELPINTGV